ncbi:nuclear transport factor 2 family protein [Pseudonocardia xinjiangensis]|uniref:nuclear transport factor 2 family protein n=1 Tax=Pseudonocardia xinjiangensis TaxID=75289 RepID=UPI003D8C8822
MTTTETSPREIGVSFHHALATRDWPMLRALMSPNVTWTLPGDNAISGTAAGIDDVIARAELIAGYGVSSTLERVLVSRKNLAIGLRATARRGEHVLDEYIAAVCTLRQGLIVQVEAYLDDVDGMNAFFARDGG